MIKEKQYRLILKEPGRGDKILVEGNEEFVLKHKTELSFKYNSDFLVIEEIKDKEGSSSIKKLVVCLVCSIIALIVYGKEK